MYECILLILTPALNMADVNACMHTKSSCSVYCFWFLINHSSYICTGCACKCTQTMSSIEEFVCNHKHKHTCIRMCVHCHDVSTLSHWHTSDHSDAYAYKTCLLSVCVHSHVSFSSSLLIHLYSFVSLCIQLFLILFIYWTLPLVFHKLLIKFTHISLSLSWSQSLSWDIQFSIIQC
jgi:hypothetical protein